MALRINSITQTNPSISEKLSADRPVIDFKKTLTQIQVNNHRELEEFISNLDKLGKKLMESLSLKDLAGFRESVKTFLRSTFGQSSQMQEESYWDIHGRPKVLSKLNKINKALDDLGHQFIANNPKPMEVLAKIDQIRGLILDLFA